MEKSKEIKDKATWKEGKSERNTDGSLEKYTGETSSNSKPNGFGEKTTVKKTLDNETAITVERGIFEDGEFVHGVIEVKIGKNKTLEGKVKTLNGIYKDYIVCVSEGKVFFEGFTLNGNFVKYYSNGNKAEEGYFDEEYHFVIGTKYEEDGKISYEGKFNKKGNIVEGICYNEYGKIACKGKFNKKGEIVEGIGYYKNDDIIVTCEGKFDEKGKFAEGAVYHDGKIACKGKFDQDKIVEGAVYHKNSDNIFQKGKFKNGEFAEGIMYDEIGKALGGGNFENGKFSKMSKKNVDAIAGSAKLAIEHADESIKDVQLAIEKAKMIGDISLKIKKLEIKKNGLSAIRTTKQKDYIDDNESVVVTNVEQSELGDIANINDLEGLFLRKKTFNINQENSLFTNEKAEINEEEEEQKSSTPVTVMIAAKQFIRKGRLQSSQMNMLNLSRESSINKNSVETNTADVKNIRNSSNGSNFEKIKTQRGLSMYTQRDNIKSRKASVYTTNYGQELKIPKKAEELLKNHDYKRATRSISQSISAAKNVANGPKDVSQERISSWNTSWKMGYKKKEANKNNTKESTLL